MESLRKVKPRVLLIIFLLPLATILALVPENTTQPFRLTAEELLQAGDPRGALSPEQKALQHLQRAEAMYGETEVSQQQGGGQGGGGEQANADDLADLFELELDRMRNPQST